MDKLPPIPSSWSQISGMWRIRKTDVDLAIITHETYPNDESMSVVRLRVGLYDRNYHVETKDLDSQIEECKEIGIFKLREMRLILLGRNNDLFERISTGISKNVIVKKNNLDDY